MDNGNNYSKSKFGDILRKRRRACGFQSCSKLAVALLPSANASSNPFYYEKSIETLRKKIERWETGQAEPNISDFKLLCDVLECDPEYLWGTCPTPRRETKQAMDITGLSEKAIDHIIAIKGSENERLIELNKLLGSKEIDHLLSLMSMFSYNIEDLLEAVDKSRIYAMEHLKSLPVASDSYIGPRWKTLPKYEDNEFPEFRRLRFEITDHFSNMIDNIYRTSHILDSVAEIDAIYTPWRVGNGDK